MLRILILISLFLATAFGQASEGLLSGGSGTVHGSGELDTIGFNAYQASGNIVVMFSFLGVAQEFKATFPGVSEFGVTGTITSTCPNSSPGYVDIYSPSTFSIVASYTVGSVSNAPFNFGLSSYGVQQNQLFILRLRTGSTSCELTVSGVSFGFILGTTPSSYVGIASLNSASLVSYSPITNLIISGYTSTSNSGQFDLSATSIIIEDGGLGIITFSFQLQLIDCTSNDDLIFTFTIHYGSGSSQFVLTNDQTGFYSVSYAFNAAPGNSVYAELSTRVTEASHGCEFQMGAITLTVDEIIL